MKNIQNFITTITTIAPLIQAIKQHGGTSYAVGGSVRDLVLGREIKDLDIEVHGVTLENLELILKKFGHVKLVGKKFGVLRVYGYDIDWSLPRRDSAGRKPTVTIDPHLTIQEAARRRDLTMNALAIDLNLFLEMLEQNQETQTIEAYIIDPYGGLKDMQEKKLRAIDDHLFLEDPLRFFRVMQFISRFEMQPDPHLTKLCHTMQLHDNMTDSPLAKERIYEEIKKLCLQSYRPSLGFRWLTEIGRLEEIFPELHALVGVMQLPEYHPEGDAFEHTMQALDAAARLEFYEEGPEKSANDEKFMIMLSVLCHDLGKATTTDEQFHAYGHDKAGVKLAESLLKRFTNDIFILKAVGKLVRYHMEPFGFLRQKSSPQAYKRLAVKLAPEVTLRQLALVAVSDSRGTNPKGHEPFSTAYQEEFDEFLKQADRAKVLFKPEPPVLLGRHLMDIVQPGPLMGELLKEAYNIQIEENIKDAEELKQLILKKSKLKGE